MGDGLQGAKRAHPTGPIWTYTRWNPVLVTWNSKPPEMGKVSSNYPKGRCQTVSRKRPRERGPVQRVTRGHAETAPETHSTLLASRYTWELSTTLPGRSLVTLLSRINEIHLYLREGNCSACTLI